MWDKKINYSNLRIIRHPPRFSNF